MTQSMKLFPPYRDSGILRVTVRGSAVVAFLLIFVFISCEFPARDDKIVFGQEFRVEYDRTVRLEDDTELRFLELKKDSRCPDDGLCPHEGEAIIAIALEHEDRIGSVIELKIPGFVDIYSTGRHKPEEYWGYKFTLLQLDPYPLTDHPERKHRYVATIVVEKINGEEVS